MSSFMALTYIFLQKYLVPLLFVIGLMNFVYGCIEYYGAGLSGGDEERAHKGRLYLLRSLSWFFIGLVVYSLISFFGWLGSGALRESLIEEESDANFGVDLEEDRNTLGVPNVPRGNDE